jgi:IclR family transcriptional regulator, acetate operon repressor
MRPVELAIQLIEILSQHQPAGVSELARLSGAPKSTVQRTLHALEKTRWIEIVDPDRALWALTMRAVVASGRATRSHAGLRSLAIPVMEELRRATEETVHLTYRFGRSVVLIERLDGIRPVRYFFAHGAVTALHAASTGRAILSRLPPEELEAYLETPLAAVTPSTITDPELFRQEIARAREQGFATSFGGNVADVHAVGAAICDPAGRPFAALSISAPSERLSPALAQTYGPMVADAARRISLGASMQPAPR